MPTPRTKPPKRKDDQPISLAPLDFETAVRAAMQTGKPPKEKAKPQKRKAKK